MRDFIETITNTALCHEPYCECVVCRAASGDREAMKRCEAAHTRARRKAIKAHDVPATPTVIPLKRESA